MCVETTFFEREGNEITNQKVCNEISQGDESISGIWPPESVSISSESQLHGPVMISASERLCNGRLPLLVILKKSFLVASTVNFLYPWLKVQNLVHSAVERVGMTRSKISHVVKSFIAGAAKL
jgi:hypothetical protein